MKPERRTVDTVNLPLSGGRILRLELHRHPEGDPAELVLCLGWGEPERFDRKESLVLPGEILMELHAALQHVERGT